MPASVASTFQSMVAAAKARQEVARAEFIRSALGISSKSSVARDAVVESLLQASAKGDVASHQDMARYLQVACASRHPERVEMYEDLHDAGGFLNAMYCEVELYVAAMGYVPNSPDALDAIVGAAHARALLRRADVPSELLNKSLIQIVELDGSRPVAVCSVENVELTQLLSLVGTSYAKLGYRGQLVQGSCKDSAAFALQSYGVTTTLEDVVTQLTTRMIGSAEASSWPTAFARLCATSPEFVRVARKQPDVAVAQARREFIRSEFEKRALVLRETHSHAAWERRDTNLISLERGSLDSATRIVADLYGRWHHVSGTDVAHPEIMIASLMFCAAEFLAAKKEQRAIDTETLIRIQEAYGVKRTDYVRVLAKAATTCEANTDSASNTILKETMKRAVVGDPFPMLVLLGNEMMSLTNGPAGAVQATGRTSLMLMANEYRSYGLDLYAIGLRSIDDDFPELSAFSDERDLLAKIGQHDLAPSEKWAEASVLAQPDSAAVQAEQLFGSVNLSLA